MNINREDALAEIAAIAKRNNISATEITAALARDGTQEETEKNTAGMLKKIFGYVGGILILSGIGAFVGMFWGDMGAAARVLVTLGTGFFVFIMGLATLNDEKYRRTATPLFLIAAFLQPAGILVMLDEFSSGGNPQHAVLFAAFLMLIQQGTVFWKKQATVLAFTSMFFFGAFFSNLFSILGVPSNVSVLIVSISLLCLSYRLSKSPHAAITPFWHFVSAGSMLCASYDILEDAHIDVLFLGLCVFTIYLSTALKSRSILLVSTLAMLCYIGKFTAEHFANNVGWPVALIVAGVLFLGIGSLAVRINNKYIRQTG